MTLHCRIATTWDQSGAFDEDAYRAYLQRFVDTRLGVYMASGGLEGFALTYDELAQVYRAGVAHCRGKVFVGANLEEEHTARDTLARAQIAVAAGVDVINIYGPAGWHGYRCTDAEYLAFFDRILGEIRYPVALCPNQILGYAPSARVISAICHKYHQVVAVNLTGVPDDVYFVNLMDELRREIEIYVTYRGSLNTFGMGAAGLLGVEANLIPATFRQYIDLYEAGDYKQLAVTYAHLKRVTQLTERWNGANARWVKMAMKVFRLLGWAGGLREPYVMPDDEELAAFTRAALALKLPEIDEMARQAGLLLAVRTDCRLTHERQAA